MRFYRQGTGSTWAIKSMKKVDLVRLRQVEHILSEKRIMASVEHPFVVRFGGCFQGSCRNRARCHVVQFILTDDRVYVVARDRCLADEKFVHLVLEYAPGGEFFTHLQKAGRLENDAARFYAAQVILIVEYLHQQGIVYRDLKPENLLLDTKGYFKLTDFGFAKKVAFKTYTLCGTPEYVAPEMLLNKGHGQSVDWWGFGILLFEMLSGHTPFVADDPMDVYKQILECRVRFPKCATNFCPPPPIFLVSL